MAIVVECHCRHRFSAADSLQGTFVACPGCGAPIMVAAPPARVPVAAGPFSAGTQPNTHRTAWQQFTRNPFWFFLHGVDLAEYQRTQTPPATRKVQKLFLAGLALVVLGLALLTFLIATVRFGIWLGLGMSLMGLGVAFVPLLFGFYFVAAGLLESNLLMLSRNGRGVRYLFGDQGARWFFIISGCPALLIGLLIQLGFVAGAAIGHDPKRAHNAPAQVTDDPRHHFERPALEGAEADRILEQRIEEHRREFADILKDPEMAAEFEKSLRERLPNRKVPPP
jgi:hypothetical protein